MTGDGPELVEENRRRLCAEVGADPARLVLNRQVHGTHVHRAVAGARGEEGDGLWTDEPTVPLLALTADCVPVVLARTNGGRPAAAVVTAGRRGLRGGVLEAAVAALGGRPAAVVGPAIGPCCYEVGDEVRAPYQARFGAAVLRDRHVDLWRAAELSLVEAGCTSV